MGRLRPRPLLAAAMAALLGSLAWGPAPAASQDGSASPARTVPVWQGVERQVWDLRTPGGERVAAEALAVTDPRHVTLRAVLAQGSVPGLETLESMGRRLLPHGAVAGVNGGFWLYQPFGEPNSYLAIDGQLVSESETQGETMRGTFGVREDGRPLVDRVATRIHLAVEGGDPLTVDGLNRLHRGGDDDASTPQDRADPADVVYVYTPHFGRTVTVPESGPAARGDATAVVLEDVAVPAAGSSASAPAPRYDAIDPGVSVDIPPGGVVVLAYGERRQELIDTVIEGLPVTIVTELSTLDRDRAPEWSGVRDGLAAGPLLLRDGRAVVPDACYPEGFNPGTHCAPRAPRSAIGHTAEGRIVMATVDGRQAGHSAGMTMVELAAFMRRLGAVEAIALDGGGSTTMVVDGRVTNRPSDGAPRVLGSGLFLFHDHALAGTSRLAGAGREATAAAIALEAYPDGSGEVVIAAGGDYPDALAGGPLASRLGAPLLLTRTGSLPPETLAALDALGPARATVLGGTAAVSEHVAAQLSSRGIEVRRIAGATRVDTAARIAATLGGGRQRVFVAWQGGFADALSAAAPAGMLDAPVVLSAASGLPEASAKALRDSGAGEVVLVGGSRVLSREVEREVAEALPGARVRRLAGPTRFGTNRAVNEWASEAVGDLDASGLVVAQGEVFPDALAGGPFAARRRQLLAIVPPVDVNRDVHTREYLGAQRGGLRHVTVLGGHAVLSSYQQLQLSGLAGG